MKTAETFLPVVKKLGEIEIKLADDGQFEAEVVPGTPLIRRSSLKAIEKAVLGAATDKGTPILYMTGGDAVVSGVAIMHERKRGRTYVVLADGRRLSTYQPLYLDTPKNRERMAQLVLLDREWTKAEEKHTKKRMAIEEKLEELDIETLVQTTK